MASAKSTPTAAPAAPASAAEVSTTASRAYLTPKVDPETGDVSEVSLFRYLTGHPRQIRFDAKAGVFNVNGEKVIGKSISFIPLAWRIFQDNILNMGRKQWAELFFVDESGAVCAVLFHGYSVENLLKLNAGLFYDDLSLSQVVLTVTATKKENKKVGGTYYIAEFSYSDADPQAVQARAEFAADHDIYREETVTGEADISLFHGYRLPEHHEPQRRALPVAEPEAVSAG